MRVKKDAGKIRQTIKFKSFEHALKLAHGSIEKTIDSLQASHAMLCSVQREFPSILMSEQIDELRKAVNAFKRIEKQLS